MAREALRKLPPWSMWVLIAVVLVGLFVVRSLLFATDDAKLPLNEYPQATVDNFIQACGDAGNEQQTCQCGIDRLRLYFTYTQFKELEDAIAAGGEREAQASQTVSSIVAPCDPTP